MRTVRPFLAPRPRICLFPQLVATLSAPDSLQFQLSWDPQKSLPKQPSLFLLSAVSTPLSRQERQVWRAEFCFRVQQRASRAVRRGRAAFALVLLAPVVERPASRTLRLPEADPCRPHRQEQDSEQHSWTR